MKKLLSICFLSILLTLTGFVAQAQTSCCFWVECMQPDTLTGIANVPGGTVVLNNTMNPALLGNYQQTDVYKLHFTNSCSADKISVEWKLYENGQLVNDNLSNYADFRIYTYYNRLNSGGMIEWLGGQVLDGHGVASPVSPSCYSPFNAVNPHVCKEGYPGAMAVDNSFPFSNDFQNAAGYTSIYTQGLDYFNAEFFEQAETKIVINWKQAGKYSLVIRIRERTGGDDYPNLYWNDNQDKYVGGHGSEIGRVIAEDSIHYLVKGEFSKEVCDGGTFDYGRPVHTFDATGDYLVIFGDSTCDHFKVEKLDTLHFFVRTRPVAQFDVDTVKNCFGGSMTQADLEGHASFATPDADGLTYKELQWATTNVPDSFKAVVPTPVNTVGTYTFYVRQMNMYANFNTDTIWCDGPVDTLVYIVFPIPDAPAMSTHNQYYCVGATATTVATLATASTDCELHWSKTNTFDTEITGSSLVPQTTTAGVETFYVYQKNTVTGCYDKTHYDSVVVTVYANPTVDASVNPTAACLGSTFRVSATPRNLTRYNWTGNYGMPAKTDTAFDVTPTVAHNDYKYNLVAEEDHLVGSTVVATCQATDSVTFEVYPLPSTPTFAPTTKSYCLNAIPASESVTVTATTGDPNVKCIWFNKDRDSIGFGNTYVVDVNAIAPTTNKFDTVRFYAAPYNTVTTCVGDTVVAATFIFNKYPVVSLAATPDTVCPGASSTIVASLTTTSLAAYTYTWTGVTSVKDTAILTTSIDSCTGATYTVTVKVTDVNNCISNTDTVKVTVKDKVKPVITATSGNQPTKQLYGCNLTIVPAAYTHVDTLAKYEHLTITDACGYVEKAITHTDATTTGACNYSLVRTYTISDHCGNTANYVVTYNVTDTARPHVNVTTVTAIDPVPVANCKFNMPDVTIFDTLIRGKLSDNCTDTAYLMNSAKYYNGNTLMTSANTDIFADSNVVNVYVEIADKCNNLSGKVLIATLTKPAPMAINHGSISISKNELCLHDTVSLSFNVDSITGYAHAPYSVIWTGRPNDGTIIHHTLMDAFGVPGIPDEDFVYTITVTDKYGCVAKDSSAPIHVWNLPTATIHEVILDGSTFPLCPSYGVLTLAAVAQSQIASMPGLTYAWSGESVNIHSTNDTTQVYILPDSCDYTYTANLLVTNDKGCKFNTSYSFDVLDNDAPYVEAGSTITDTTLVRQPGCKFVVPDFLPLFSNTNVKDNCYRFGEFDTVYQSPVANTEISANTPVVITFVDHCGNTGTYTINANLPNDHITITGIAIDQDAYCLGGTSVLTPSISNGTTPFTYKWTEGTDSLYNDMVFTVTPTTAGTHTYTLTVKDANDCQHSLSADVITVHPMPAAADVTLASTPNQFCTNALDTANGTISVSNMPAGFMYKMTTDTTWHDATYVYTALKHGTYSFDLKSDHDCITTNVVTKTVDSSSTLYLSHASGTENIRCAAPYSGRIEVTDPMVGYTYEIVSVPNTQRTYTSGSLVYDSLMDGDYVIHVVSDKFCPYNIENTIVARNITYPAMPDYDTIAQTSCVTPNASFIVLNSDTNCSYTFNMVTLPGNNGNLTFSGLDGGSYNLTVLNNVTACSSTFYAIGVPTRTINPDSITVKMDSNTVCDLALVPNGALTVVSPIHGYSYELNGKIFTFDSLNPVTVKFDSLIDASSYQIRITSDLGCSSVYTYEVAFKSVVPQKPTSTPTSNTVCNMTLPSWAVSTYHPTANGQIVLTNTDDTKYSYKLLLGGSEITPSSTHTYTGLDANDNYIVEITDNVTGCVNTDTVKVLDGTVAIPTPTEYATTPRTSCTALDGAITITGATGYEYFIQGYGGGLPMLAATNLDNGKYVILKHNITTGCYRIDTVTVADHRLNYNDSIQITMVPDSTCDDMLTGMGSLTVTNPGTTNFLFRIDGGTYTSNNVFSNLQDGTYTIEVYNTVTFCTGTKTGVAVSEVVTKPVINAQITAHNTHCDPAQYNGEITITAKPNETYRTVKAATFDSVSVETTVSGLAPGAYKVIAKNVLTGCADTSAVFTIKDTTVTPLLSATSTANYVCTPVKNGTVTITSSNVTSGLTYYLYGASLALDSNTTGVFSDLDSGTYTYYAISDLACPSITYNVTVLDSAHVYGLQLTQQPNTMCTGTFTRPGTGRIIVTNPQARHYKYSFYDASDNAIDVNYFNPDSYTMYYLSDQKYRVRVQDSITKCIAEDTITVTLQLDNINVSADSVNNTRCNAPYDGSITVTIANPTVDGVYRYQLNGGAFQESNVFTGLKDSIHNIVVWDTTTNCLYPTSAGLNITVEKTNYTATVNPVIAENNYCVAPFNGAVTLAADSVTGTTPSGAYKFAFYEGVATVSPDTLAYTSDTTYTQLNSGTYTVYIWETTKDCYYGPQTVVVPNNSANKPSVSFVTSGYNNVDSIHFCVDAPGKICADVTPNVTSDTLGFGYLWSCNCFPWTVTSDSSCIDVETSAERLHCVYTVQVTSLATGCVTVDSIHIHIDTVPQIHFYFENPTHVNVASHAVVNNCENNDYTVGITNPISQYDSIFWTQGHIESGVTSFVEPANKYSSVAPIEISYCVNVVDKNGCIAHDYMNVRIKQVAKNTITVPACDSALYTDYKGVDHKFYFDTLSTATNIYTVVDTIVGGAANGCDSILTVNIQIQSSPKLTVDSAASYIERHVCHGTPLHTDDMLTVKYTTTFGWKFGNTANYNASDADFDPTANMDYANNGRKVYAYALNNCDTVEVGPFTLNIDSMPLVPHITVNALAPYCDSTLFTTAFTAPTVDWKGNTGTTSWTLEGMDSTITNLVYAMNGKKLSYRATNACGTSYSDTITLDIYNTAKMDLAYTFDSLCVGTNGTVTLTLNTGNSDTAVCSNNYFHFTKSGNVYTIIPDSANTGASTITFYAFAEPTVPSPIPSSKCSYVTKVVTFHIVDKPVVGNVANPDSMCAGQAISGLLKPSVDPKNGEILSQGWVISTSLTGTYVPFNPLTPLTMANHGNYIKYQVINRCDTVYSNAVPVVVDTLVSASLTPNPVEVCAGTVLVAPTHYVQTVISGVTATAPIDSSYLTLKRESSSTYAKYLSTPVSMADSNASLRYLYGNRCGVSYSNVVTLIVNDTASLLVTSKPDSICVGSYDDITVTVHKSNIVTFAALDASFTYQVLDTVISTDKVMHVRLTGADAIQGNISKFAIRVVAASADCTNDKLDTVKFTVRDTAHFSNAGSVAPVCEGGTLAPVVPTYTTPNAHVVSSGWQTNVSGSWADFTSIPMTAAYDSTYLRYKVETECGTVYSTPIMVIVFDTLKLTAGTVTTPQEVCSGTAMTANTYDMVSADIVTLSFAPATITGVTGSVSGNVYTVSGNPAAGFGTYTGTVTAQDTNHYCPMTKTITFELKVDTMPAITFNNAQQTYCIGDPQAFKVGEVVTLNSYDNTDSTVYGHIKLYNTTTHTYGAWESVDPYTTITANLDSALVSFTVKNHCDSSAINDSLLVIVKGKATITDPVKRDTCSAYELYQFIKTYPVVKLPTNSTTILDSGWVVKTSTDTLAAAYNTPITQDTTVMYFVETDCGKVYTNPVNLVVITKPDITDTILTSQFRICDGGKFTKPALLAVTNNGTMLDTLWTITKFGSTVADTLKFEQAYDVTYDSATISMIVTNDCFSDTVIAYAKVDTLPIPLISKDTIICGNGTTTVAVTTTYDEYEWYANGVAIPSTNTQTYTFNATGDSLVHFTVRVKDGNNCYSKTNVNISTDTAWSEYVPTAVTVVASDLPRFRFTDANGNVTHRLPNTTTSTNAADMTHYTWTVENYCQAGNDLVFVTFDIYRNGTLIENTAIGTYMMEQTIGSAKWVTSDEISYETPSHTPQTRVNYFDYATYNNTDALNMGNHFPNTKLAGSASDNYDDVYMHFLHNRPVSKTIAPFLYQGEYKIVYRLWHVNNINLNGDHYYNADTTHNLLIGGYNSLYIAPDMIIEDEIYITVTGDTLLYAPEPVDPAEPEPIMEPVEEPVVNIYPNPTSGQFTAAIEGFEGATVVRIATLAGKVISEEVINPSKTSVYIYKRTANDLTPGVYFLNVQNGESRLSKKLVVTR